jgi:16S rRNA (uracil1498-N3)-methyltransferase
MRANYKLKRLFVEADLAAAQAFAMSKDQAHYLVNVLRMSEGAELLVFNGRDGEWRAQLSAVSRKSAEIIPIALERAQPQASDLQFCFAPIKVGRLDWMVEKAVELGAGVIQPVLTQFTQNTRLNMDKMQRWALEAAEQCGVLAIPHIRQPVSLAQLLDDWNSARRLIFCDEAADGDNPLPILQRMPEHQLAVLIGPEGGFSDDERERLRALPFVTAIPLGPRILRADTAAVAALTLVQAVRGDWHTSNNRV